MRESSAVSERNRYSENRRRSDKAASYDVKYEQEFHKRVSDRREKRLLESILATAGSHERMLDVPCGAGRLSGVLSRFADKVVEMDYSFPMLELCRQNAVDYVPQMANGNVLHLPFCDVAFDIVASIRVSHHLPKREDRLNHVRELCRVSSRHVLVTIFDEDSFKNRLRKFRTALWLKKKPKKTLSIGELRSLGDECGFDVAGSWSLSRMFSGHSFVLLRRRAA